jgi:hypothetical protein
MHNFAHEPAGVLADSDQYIPSDINSKALFVHSLINGIGNRPSKRGLKVVHWRLWDHAGNM